jgi:hypothetical protein
MNESNLRSRRPWFWAGVLVTALKLWLTRAQPVYAIGPAAHDDRLFLLMAENIVHGDWLGEYSQMTLAKGPFYSIWIAVLYWLAIPLGLGVQLAYAGACALFARACRPAIQSGAVLFVLYAFLLWNPMSFEAPTLGRIIRQQIYTPLELAVLAGLVALYCRRQENLRRHLPWAGLAGLAFGCFWLTREESFWLIPTTVLLAGAGVYWAFRASREHGRTLLKSLGVVVVFALLPLAAVSWQNYRHYGWFGTVEFRASEFKDAYGAMVRVKVGPGLDFVPVTRQAREAIYQVSPTFAQLQPYLEGDYGRAWAAASEPTTKLPPEERQIGNGWLMWALRDTVAAAGFCHSARDALAFYRRMADEINDACDDGRLPAYPRRSGFLPIWKSGDAAEVLRTTWYFADFAAGYKSFSAYPHQSTGTDDEVRLFRDLTRDRLSLVPDATNFILPNQIALDTWKLDTLQSVGKALRQVLIWLFLAAHALVLIRLVQFFWTRQLTFPLVLAAAAWGGSLGYLLLNAIVQVTSFSVVAVSTFWPVYPLLQVFTFAAFWDAASAWFGRPAPAAPAPAA